MALGVAGEDGSEVEPEAIHVHLADPVAETVQNHPADNRVIGVESVAGAAVVGVAGSVRLQDVIGFVFNSAEAQPRPVLVAFGGVVEHDVQNHFQAGAMEGLYQVAKLVERSERSWREL